MKLTLDIDLNTDSREQISMIANMLNQITNAARRPSSGTQPQVVQNSGSIGQGFTLSPVDDAVTGVSIPADEAEPKDTPVVVKDAVRRPRAKKEDAPTPVAEEPKAEPVTDAAAASTSESADAAKVPAAASTIDDVRAALQAYTAKHGVPAGIDLLKGFGAARISELKDADYAAFVEQCA